jgi:uncharacterized RDD family membrane protein YckC
MKCPKCGYLGFETSDRCRNCGYDFSLTVAVDPPTELPLRSADGAGAPLADLELGNGGERSHTDSAALNLDRVIGAPSSRPGRTPPEPLPLFPPEARDDAPMVAAPRPAGTPLSVRRTTPETPRARSRTDRPRFEMLDEGEVPSFSESAAVVPPPRITPLPTSPGVVEFRPASRGARLLAAGIDLALLAVVDGIVVYLTLALTGLTRQSLSALPIAPLAGFLAMLNGGYLIAFVAASGQTPGKMITGLRVMSDDGRRVDIGGAVLRAAGCAVSVLTAGLGYLPAFVTGHGRALQDRIAGTRVISVR